VPKLDSPPFAAIVEEARLLRHPDLTPLMQALLLGSILVLTMAALVRFGLFFRNRHACLPYRYPAAWTAEQVTMFGRLRLAIGGCLAVTWATFMLTAPQLPVGWPFGFEEALLTIGLLLLTNGWLVLLVRLNWENSLLSKWRFRTGFAVVTLWWIAVFALILATIGWATTAHLHLVFPYGTIA
jgi:hypothetical protein